MTQWISAITSIGVAIFLFYFYRQQNKRDCEAEKKALARAKEGYLIMLSVDAIGSLAYATAIAVKKGEINGEMDPAISKYQKVSEELEVFIKEQASYVLHKEV